MATQRSFTIISVPVGGNMRAPMDEHLAQWTEAGWRLEHVTEQRAGYGGNAAEYSLFWIKDS